MNSLNDYFISRDVIGYLEAFCAANPPKNQAYLVKLEQLSSKQSMSYAEWWKLLEELETDTDYTALGIEIGRQITVSQVGVLGYLFRTARNVGEALSCFKRFQGLIYAGSQAHTELTANDSFAMVWNPEHGYSSQSSDELLLSAMIAIVNEIISPKSLTLKYVSFTQKLSLERQEACEEYFHCQVNSHQERLAIAFSASDLLIEIPHSDKTLHGILGQQAQDLLVSLPDSDTFISELTDNIIRCLHEGVCDATSVAFRMNISERTMHRKLKTKGKVYRDLLREIRKSMALNYLRDSKLTLAEISLLLGYGEQSSFTRAFSNWYHCSPLQYQKRHLN